MEQGGYCEGKEAQSVESARPKTEEKGITLLTSKLCEKGSLLNEPPFSACSREVLIHAVCYYVRAASFPGKRAAIARSGITEKRLKAQVKYIDDLVRFLRELLDAAGLVRDELIKNYFPWKRDLEWIRDFLKTLEPSRYSEKDAALVLALHVEQKTGRKHRKKIAELINFSCKQMKLEYGVTPPTLNRQIKRGNRRKAQELLSAWTSAAAFAAATKTQPAMFDIEGLPNHK